MSDMNTHDFIDNINTVTLQKMVFVFNALQNGWIVEKKNNLYIFNKKHEGQKEIYLDNYLKQFINKNLDINSIMVNK